MPLSDAPIGEADDAGDRHTGERLQRRAHAPARAHGLHPELEDLLEVAIEALDRIVLEPECLDQAGARQVLGQPRGHVAELGLRAPGNRAQPPADAAERQYGNGKHRQYDDGQHPVDVEHGADDGDDREAVLDEGDHRYLRRLLNEGEVVGQSRDQVARRLPGEAREVGVDEMGEGRLLDIGDHARDDARARHLMQIEEDAAQRRDHDDGGQHPGQDLAVGPHQRVEGMLDDERIAAGGGGEPRGKEQRDQDLPPAGPYPIIDEAAQRAARALVEGERAQLAVGFQAIAQGGPRRRLLRLPIRSRTAMPLTQHGNCGRLARQSVTSAPISQAQARAGGECARSSGVRPLALAIATISYMEARGLTPLPMPRARGCDAAPSLSAQSLVFDGLSGLWGTR